MQEIEILAMKTYEQNLNYIAQKEPKLLSKIALFDMPETGISPKYELEYKDDYFDVVELSSGLFLYGRDSNEYAKKIAKSIDYKKTSSLFEGIRDQIVTKDDIVQIKKDQKDINLRLNDVPLIMYEAMKLAPRTTLMKTIDKFIFIGVGLGQHIIEAHNKIHASEYFIIEDDIELFRLSLFVTPYYELAKDAQLRFSISQSESEFLPKMALFLEATFYNNKYLKYLKFPAHSDIKIKAIQAVLASQGHHTFPYGVKLEKYLRPLGRIADGYSTLSVANKFTESLFVDNPILVLAAGPSLKKNIDWIKKYEDKFIIIAVGSALKTLQNNDIKPDIVTHIDGFVEEGNSCMSLYNDIDIDGFLKNTIFILGPHAPDALLKILNKEHLFLTEESTFYYKDYGSLSASCVGSISTILAIHLNAKNIYLLGLDLALDQISGATHSDEHYFNKTHDLSKTDELDYTISLKSNIIQTKGNFTPAVYTTPEFMASIQTLRNFIPVFKSDIQNIYNLSDGAFLPESISIHAQEVNAETLNQIDKISLGNEILHILKNHSQIGMNSDDLDSMQKRLEIAKSVQNIILQYSKKEYSNENKYMYDLLGIVSEILKLHGREANNLAAVFGAFFSYTIPYIMDIINTQKITKIMTHVKKIDGELIEGMLNIVNRYIDTMELFLEKMKK
ncbi:MAG: hypothetical protein A3K14_02095 [Sulfurimonas sp. RIFCSPLOWO2_12_FULL_36_74]|nr:MAG: hypothetical protein A3J26_04375 [Sulfurimonas sp. RIFCSPLOWO2_02_FULL_36_28]OHE07056.1 MAG: hypothetical protein A3K14_02095 [Sulfurimonas sp. RIFCSPLOWO2_12_FULL_36_74]